ncbi:MAG TPA: hypothetical protein PKI36_03260 [Turneriella sp.]|nr:hypothetical protein [Turneriella sp.]
MYNRSKLFLFTVFVATSYLAPRTVEASCGMGVCPLPVAGGLNAQALAGTGVLPSQLAVESRYVSFDIGGKGSYLQNAVSGVYEHRYFRAGGIVPLIYLSSPAGETFGLGNTTLFGEVYLFTQPGTRLSVGSQLETPTGNHDKGLGADHFMAVPYINFWQMFGDWRFAVQTGFQQTLGHHTHAATTTVLYVNPHTDTDLMARAMASYTWQARYSAELGSVWRQVMAHDAQGDKTFVDLGLAFRAALLDTLAVRAGVDVPLASRTRYLWQAYASVYAYF